MANELRIRLTANLATDVQPDKFDESVSDDQATEVVEAGSQLVGFAVHELIDLGDVATPSVMILRNADPTNYVEIGIDQAGTFVPVGKIRPGKLRLEEPLAAEPLYAKANTAAIRLDKFIPST